MIRLTILLLAILITTFIVAYGLIPEGKVLGHCFEDEIVLQSQDGRYACVPLDNIGGHWELEAQ